MRCAAVKIGFVAVASLAFAQAPSSPEFEVASVKLASSGNGFRGGPGTSSPERITYSGVPLLQLIIRAYGVPSFQISGTEWLSSERYEIVANVPPGTTKDDLSLMLQNLRSPSGFS